MKAKTIKSFTSIAVALFLSFVFVVTAFAADNEFVDVSNPKAPYYKAVYWMVDQGIIKGYSNGHFGPEDSCTREQFAIMIWRLSGKPDGKGTVEFTDVEESAASYKAISWAVGEGIIKGFSDNTFRPKDTVTRQQVAIMLYRMAGEPEIMGGESFSDITSATSGFNAIRWGSKVDVIRGYSDNTFKPEDNCLRMHIAIMLYRYSKNVENKSMDVQLPEHAPEYTLDAKLMDGLPGVYEVKAVKGDNLQNATIGIPSIAKQNLKDVPTTETPAIIMGAAVNYEKRIGPVEYEVLPGAQLVAPYKYFRHQIIEETITDADGNKSTHKKSSGFDGTYYIVRVDVSDIIFGKSGYLHVKQESNKALMAALGIEGLTFADGMGNKNASYKIENNGTAMKDSEGNYMDKPYLDVIMLSSGKLAAGADQGTANAPSADIKLSFYIDDVDDYNPSLKYDPASTDVNHAANCLKKFYDDSKATADNNATSYLIKDSDLEIDVTIDDMQTSGNEADFWSLTSAIAHQEFDDHTIKLICEVPVLEGLKIVGSSSAKRNVVLDVNSYDIQVANHAETNTAGITVGDNATLTILDGSKTYGAELAIGNNASMEVLSGGTMIIDKSCSLEVEFDAASVTNQDAASQGSSTPLSNGEIFVRKGGKLINNGVVNIEGTEAKPQVPSSGEQASGETVTRDIRKATMIIEEGAVFDNYGCVGLKGSLYVLGTLNNYGKYSEVITAGDPDKGYIDHHKGIQVTWKDDVVDTEGKRTEGVEPGDFNVGLIIGADKNQEIHKNAVLNNYGDIVLVPGVMNVYGTFNNTSEANLYSCQVTEAVIPITPDPNDPTKTEQRVKFQEPVDSVINVDSGATVKNDGNTKEATVEIISNGVLGNLTEGKDITITP